MTSMEDLIATISGGMHVSQEGYDLKALQEYLSRTIVLPNVVSPGGAYAYAPGPSSRANSMTRKPILTGSYPPHAMSGSSEAYYPGSAEMNHHGHAHGHAHEMYQPYPSPIATVAEDPLPQPHRPASLRRSSSYGFGGGPSSPYMEYSSFEGDAFAPLVQPEKTPANMWGTPASGAGNAGKPNPWAAFQAASGYGPGQWGATRGSWDAAAAAARAATMGHSGYRPPTPPDEDDEMMDEDQVDSEIDEVPQRAAAAPHHPHLQSSGMGGQGTLGLQGLQGVDNRIPGQMQPDWERGRRKQ